MMIQKANLLGEISQEKKQWYCPRALGFWQPSGHCIQFSEHHWFHFVSSFYLRQFCLLLLAPPSVVRPSKRNSQEMNTISLLALQQAGIFLHAINLPNELVKTEIPWLIISGKRNERWENIMVVFSRGCHVPGTVWSWRIHSNSEEYVRWDYWDPLQRLQTLPVRL